MCSTYTEPGQPERKLSDCGRCACHMSSSYGRHSPVTKTETDKQGNVRTWRECSRCGSPA